MTPGPKSRLCLRLAVALVVLNGHALPKAWGHESRPALLQITERPHNRYDIIWKQPARISSSGSLTPLISGGLLLGPPSVETMAPGYEIRMWRNVPGGAERLQGRTVEIEGLDRSITDVLLSIQLQDGRSIQRILQPDRPRLELEFREPLKGYFAYLRLGVTHIFEGMDHLAFIAGLMLLVRRRIVLIQTITAFTVAHSITLIAVSLQWLTVRAATIEPLVALSILFVAREIWATRRGERSLMTNRPWLIAFSFGLLHGAAFAGALADAGLRREAVVPAVLLFNLGVETGQLIFIGIVLALASGVRRVQLWRHSWGSWATTYALGTLSMFWFLERLATALERQS